MIHSEKEAETWITDTFHVSRETIERLQAFAALLRQENERQNLVSRFTLDHLWVRHVADSAQLLLQAPGKEEAWLDIGSGAGFPGLIIAALRGGPVTLVEARRLRAEFLQRAAGILGVSPHIVCDKVERLPLAAAYGVISARAVASASDILALSHAFSTENTRWVLPKGRSAQTELEGARASWHGVFRLVPSLTDADASIIIAEGVRPKGQRNRA